MNPLTLLEALHPMRSHGSLQQQTRHCRMYLLACARRQWHRLPNVCRTLVKLAEVYADAPRKEEKLRAALAPIAERLMHSEGENDDLVEAETELTSLPMWNGVSLNELLTPHEIGQDTAKSNTSTAALTLDEWRGLSALVYLPFEPNTPTFRWAPRPLHSLRLLREVYGNACRYTRFDPNWRTDTVLTLARQMYVAREFSAMPILADALQDAGCDDGDILVHCRDPRAKHVRGCWVLDLVLDFK